MKVRGEEKAQQAFHESNVGHNNCTLHWRCSGMMFEPIVKAAVLFTEVLMVFVVVVVLNKLITQLSFPSRLFFLYFLIESTDTSFVFFG